MKIIKIISVVVVGIALLFFITKPELITASSISDMRKDINANNAKIRDLNAKIKNLNSTKKTTAVEVELLDLELEKLTTEAEGIKLEIEEKESMIKESTLAIEDKIKKIDENNTLLENRLRASYKRGDVGYLQILLNSENIVDALTRADVIQLIVEDDVKLLKEIKAQKSDLEDLKSLQEKEKKELEDTKVELSNKQVEISNSQNEKIKYMAVLEKDIEAMKEKERRWEEENERLTEEINKKLLEIAYAGGNMMWPAPGHTRVTSPFGGRIHPLYGYWSNHRGTDISCPYYTEIIAANDGIVIVSEYHYSYGNYVIIDHGGKIATVYGHNEKLLVKVGDKVKKGQKIALSGSTGESTGPHLHFEVRESGVVVDPMKYIGYYLQ